MIMSSRYRNLTWRPKADLDAIGGRTTPDSLVSYVGSHRDLMPPHGLSETFDRLLVAPPPGLRTRSAQRRRRCCSRDVRRPPFIHHEHLVARGTYRASVMGEPPIGSNVVFCGSTSSASPTARSSSAGDPNGHLDVAPDRRLADLELGGADRAALAQCAEFGQ
jgi:hypothetical protein